MRHFCLQFKMESRMEVRGKPQRMPITNIDVNTKNQFQLTQQSVKLVFNEGGNPDPVVMGEDSCSEGRRFVWTFLSICTCCKRCTTYLFENTRINKKESEDGPCLKIGSQCYERHIIRSPQLSYCLNCHYVAYCQCDQIG